MWNSLWNDAAALNRIAAALVLVALTMIGFMLAKKIAARPEFAIRSVVVTAKLAHADPAHIAAVVHHELRGTFFTIDLATARDALQRVAWVRRVAVRREWPARIEIAIEEHQPLARWNDVALVNRQGEVFDAEYGEDLPAFYAPEGTSAEVAARYGEFAALLERNGDGIESITRSARGAWDVKLDDGLTVALGRENIGERWARWVSVGERYRSRLAGGRELVAIDMRYPNGFTARANGDWPRDAAAKPKPVVAQSTTATKTAKTATRNASATSVAGASTTTNASATRVSEATRVTAAKTAAKG